jgi:hypothetical protein
MTIRHLAPLALLLAFAACSGNSLNNGTPTVPDDGGSTTVDAAVAVNLRAISYNPSGEGTLSVDMDGLVASPQVAAFVRRADLDIAGYRAFSYQETGLQRTHLAFVSNNERGNLQAGAVSDGGQFNRHFGGGTYARIDSFSRPNLGTGVETGQFSYAGTYAGVFVSGDATNPNLPAGLTPYQPLRVRGTALINANFANDLVNGGVSDRVVLDDMGNVVIDLREISFPVTEIDADGRFVGDVEFFGPSGSRIGTVGGAFGGIGATDIAGALVINPIEGEPGIWEYGTFNLPRCDTAGAAPLCLPR